MLEGGGLVRLPLKTGLSRAEGAGHFPAPGGAGRDR